MADRTENSDQKGINLSRIIGEQDKGAARKFLEDLSEEVSSGGETVGDAEIALSFREDSLIFLELVRIAAIETEITSPHTTEDQMKAFAGLDGVTTDAEGFKYIMNIALHLAYCSGCESSFKKGNFIQQAQREEEESHRRVGEVVLPRLQLLEALDTFDRRTADRLSVTVDELNAAIDTSVDDANADAELESGAKKLGVTVDELNAAIDASGEDFANFLRGVFGKEVKNCPKV